MFTVFVKQPVDVSAQILTRILPVGVFIVFCRLRPGVTPPALALWDVDGDSVEDVFLGVAEWTNDTHVTPSKSTWEEFSRVSVRPRYTDLQKRISVLRNLRNHFQ